jgi:hypothetical protein
MLVHTTQLQCLLQAAVCWQLALLMLYVLER